MSLTIALKAAQAGINQAERQIAITSSNITNADQPGYTRKTLQSTYFTTGLITLPTSGVAVAAVTDPLLAKQVNQQSTTAGYTQTLSDYLADYSQSFGSTAGDATTLSSNLDDLTGTLQVLEQTPTDSSAKSKVISTAQAAAATINGLSNDIQAQRLQANNDISASVTDINQAIKTISDINSEIGVAQASGGGVGDLDDQRNQALQTLSQEMNVQYYTDAHDQMVVYTTNGSQLVGNTEHATVAYTPAGSVTSLTTYPGGFSPITINGVDVTTSINSGKLGALIQLRDTTFPGEQAKLDTLTSNLESTVNGALNQGSAYPPLNSVTSSTQVTSGTSLASSTGTLRVAVLDQSGMVQGSQDIDLSTISTVGGLVTALNAITGVSASINSSGNLVITATNSTQGIALNPMNSNIGGTGTSATQYFGFNNLFTGSDAATLRVNPALVSNTAALATGALSNTPTLAVGSRGISNGDASITTSLINALGSTQNFGAAGDFSARTSTLSNYSASIISDAAVQASNAKDNSDTASTAYSYLSTNLANELGVNVDEETANLSLLQTNYQASAQVMGVIKELFTSLLNAVG